MTRVDEYLQAATRENTRLSYQAAVDHFEVTWGGSVTGHIRTNRPLSS